MQVESYTPFEQSLLALSDSEFQIFCDTAQHIRWSSNKDRTFNPGKFIPGTKVIATISDFIVESENYQVYGIVESSTAKNIDIHVLCSTKDSFEIEESFFPADVQVATPETILEMLDIMARRDLLDPFSLYGLDGMSLSWMHDEEEVTYALYDEASGSQIENSCDVGLYADYDIFGLCMDLVKKRTYPL